MRKIFCLRSFVALMMILMVASAAYAQAGRANVKGTVRDQQGNVVAGATVTLTNAEKNFSRTQTTSRRIRPRAALPKFGRSSGAASMSRCCRAWAPCDRTKDSSWQSMPPRS